MNPELDTLTDDMLIQAIMLINAVKNVFVDVSNN